MSFKKRIALTPGTQIDTAKEISKGTGDVTMRSPQISLIRKNPVSVSTVFAPILND
jgi:hypothetical protein